MKLTLASRPSPWESPSGLTLMEAVFSLAIATLTIGGTARGYVLAAQQMERAACSAAAGFMAKGRLEQARAAKWDPLAIPPVDELVGSNFPVMIATLDIPVAGNNAHYATNTVTITVISDDPPLKMVRTECVWSFLTRGPFTNTLTIFRAPDQ